jgi:hypothetical protein
MNKKTSVLLTATIATILAGVLATVYVQSAFAHVTIRDAGGPGGPGGKGGAGGINYAIGSTSSHVLRANGGDANGGRGGDAIVIFNDSCIRADC